MSKIVVHLILLYSIVQHKVWFLFRIKKRKFETVVLFLFTVVCSSLTVQSIWAINPLSSNILLSGCQSSFR